MTDVTDPLGVMRQAILAAAPLHAAAVVADINTAVTVTVGNETVDLLLLAMTYNAVSGVETYIERERVNLEATRRATATINGLEETLESEAARANRLQEKVDELIARINVLEQKAARARTAPLPRGAAEVATMPKSTPMSLLGNVVVCGITTWDRMAAESNKLLLSLLSVQGRLLDAFPSPVGDGAAEALLAADALSKAVEAAVLPQVGTNEPS